MGNLNFFSTPQVGNKATRVKEIKIVISCLGLILGEVHDRATNFWGYLE